jgi:hypothetical protein
MMPGRLPQAASKPVGGPLFAEPEPDAPTEEYYAMGDYDDEERQTVAAPQLEESLPAGLAPAPTTPRRFFLESSTLTLEPDTIRKHFDGLSSHANPGSPIDDHTPSDTWPDAMRHAAASVFALPCTNKVQSETTVLADEGASTLKDADEAQILIDKRKSAEAWLAERIRAHAEEEEESKLTANMADEMLEGPAGHALDEGHQSLGAPVAPGECPVAWKIPCYNCRGDHLAVDCLIDWTKDQPSFGWFAPGTWANHASRRTMKRRLDRRSIREASRSAGKPSVSQWWHRQAYWEESSESEYVYVDETEESLHEEQSEATSGWTESSKAPKSSNDPTHSSASGSSAGQHRSQWRALAPEPPWRHRS